MACSLSPREALSLQYMSTTYLHTHSFSIVFFYPWRLLRASDRTGRSGRGGKQTRRILQLEKKRKTTLSGVSHLIPAFTFRVVYFLPFSSHNLEDIESPTCSQPPFDRLSLLVVFVSLFLSRAIRSFALAHICEIIFSF